MYSTHVQAVKDWQLILVTLAVAGFGSWLVLMQVAIPQFTPNPQLIRDTEAGTGFNVCCRYHFCYWKVTILLIHVWHTLGGWH